MRSFTFLPVAALGLAALASQAQATPISYAFDAIASGSVNGPISGTFSVDLASVWNTYDATSPDGQPITVQMELPDDGFGLVNWTVPGDHRTTGTIWNAAITRAKLATGGSTLTLATSAAFSRGSSGEQLFSLTYTSDTDVLYTQQNPFLPLASIATATGSYSYHYAEFGTVYADRGFTFNVTNTAAVPEPSSVALLLAGVGVVLRRRHFALQASA